MTNYIILLPPSETKNKGGNNDKIFRFVKNLKQSNYFLNLETQREFIFAKLREVISISNEKELESIFDLKGKNLQEAIEVTGDLLNKRTLKSIERYSGIMFKSINYEQMSKTQKINFDSSIIFIDGMFSLLKAEDLIPEYKLKISSKFLDVDVTKFWKENLKTIFEDLFRDKIVIDILPEAHRKVIDYTTAKEHYKITFSEIKLGKMKQSGHFSK